MDFNEVPYNTTNGLCAKYKWAKDCDLTWDGITNNKSICNKNNKNEILMVLFVENKSLNKDVLNKIWSYISFKINLIYYY